jgi:wyosine [tRNA(Phe)-imidazoG37] synthetase (radical SAM superfamily)
LESRTRLKTLSGLSIADHDCHAAGLTYVYPVISRRAGGISIGINLHPNNACNFRCVYCQVEGLVLGAGPEVDLSILERELDWMLDAASSEETRLAWAGDRAHARLIDVAFSGNGEPTTSPQFAEAVALLGRLLAKRGLLGTLRVVLITNGTMAHKPHVLDAIGALSEANGEVWFKLDRATDGAMHQVNGTHVSVAHHLEGLRRVAARCPRTWVQTCMFQWDGAPPGEADVDAYVAALAGLVADRVPLAGVHVYSLARQSHQPEAPRLSSVSAEWLDAFAARVRGLGLRVDVAL